MTDLILFAGQSNMAGRGEVEQASVCPADAALEYRAVTAPDRLVPVTEPFGFAENRPDGINDKTDKSGSLVSAFLNAYTADTGRKVIAVSASQGGSCTAKWLEEGLAADAADRLRSAVTYLESQHIRPAHTLVVWCQGESDGDRWLTREQYAHNFGRIWEMLRQAGAESCGLIQIGHYNYVGYPVSPDGQDGKTLDDRYGVIRDAQEHLKETFPDVTMIGSFVSCLSQMKDQYHYHQSAYEEVGRQAGHAMAALLETK